MRFAPNFLPQPMQAWTRFVEAKLSNFDSRATQVLQGLPSIKAKIQQGLLGLPVLDKIFADVRTSIYGTDFSQYVQSVSSISITAAYTTLYTANFTPPSWATSCQVFVFSTMNLWNETTIPAAVYDSRVVLNGDAGTAADILSRNAYQLSNSGSDPYYNAAFTSLSSTLEKFVLTKGDTASRTTFTNSLSVVFQIRANKQPTASYASRTGKIVVGIIYYR